MIKQLLLNSGAFTLDLEKMKGMFYTYLLLPAILLLGNASVHAQGSIINDYAFAESIGSPYTDIVGGTSVPGAGGVTSFTTLANFSAPIGFSFVYNNATYTNVNITDNGSVTFGAIANTPAGLTNPISNAGTYTGAISGFGAQLVGNYADGGPALTPSADGADVSYVTTGAAGSRVCTIQYKNLKRRPVTTVINGFLNFQIRLYEADHHIEIQYKDFISSNATNFAGQIGLRGLTTADWQNRTNGIILGATTFNSGAAGGAAGTTMPLRSTVAGTYVGPTPNTTFTWTPTCFNATNLLAILDSDNTTVNFNWTAPAFLTASFTNYIWEVRQGATVIAGPTTTLLTSASVTGLLPGLTYTFYVRSSCKPFAQSITATVIPDCNTPVYPYNENFEGVVVPAIPNCATTRIVTGAAMVTVNNAVAYYGFNNKNLKTGNTAATNTWFFTRKIALTAGATYRVSYKYGGSRELAQFNQKMKVMIGTSAAVYPAAPAVVDMTFLLADHPNIKSSPNTFTFHFVAPGTGNYHLGFNGYAAFNQGYLQIDEISVGNPTCFPPTALTSGQITYNSAIMSWTAPASAPSAGYEYIVSTSATTPIATTIISGVNGGTVTNLTGLTPSTTYYFWVRSNCGGELSSWSVVSSFATLAPPPVGCIPGTTDPDGQGITNVTVGSINNTTGLEVLGYGNYTNLSTNVAQTQSVSVAITYRTGFTYNTKIWIDWNDNGNFYDAGEEMVTGTSSNAVPTTLTLSFVIPVSVGAVPNTMGPHRMRIGGADIDTLVYTSGATGPCYNGTFSEFEDYSIFVTAPPPPLSLSSASTSFCSGGTSPLVTVNASAITPGPNKYDNFAWNPNVGVLGNEITGYTFSPTTPGVTTYTLTATQAASPFYSNTATYTVTVYDVPTPIVFTPATIVACDNIPTALVATGGIVSGAIILEENFNAATNGFIKNNTSTGGASPPLAAWTLRTSPYSYGGVTFASNDSSQFIMSNSDAQGSTGTTNTELISPTFLTTGYTNVSLSYWQFYRGFGSGTVYTEIWRDIDLDGVVDTGAEAATLATLKSYTTVSQGSAANFVNETIDLSAYIGQTDLRIRFKYENAFFAWYWAIDNFKITGSGPALLTWLPTTDLWLDAAGTVPYTGTATNAVYAKLTSDQTYTATATALAPPFCNTSTIVNVTVNKAGTATGNQSLVCGDTTIATNIDLTGYVPNALSTIVDWQMADNPGFVGATTVPGSANKATLTSAEVNGLSATTYFRARIQGCPLLFSNTITVTFPTVTWNGSWNPGPPGVSDNVTVTSGNLVLSSDLSICSLKINNNATVTVNPGVTLTVSGIVNVASSPPAPGGALNFLDSPTFPVSPATASLMQNPATITNGNIGNNNVTFQRYIMTRKFDYTYFASPLANTTLFNLAPSTLSDKYIKFDSNAYVWTYPNAVATTMAPGLGYGIRGPQGYSTTVLTPSLHTFTGTPNNGTYANIPVFHNIPGQDLNMLGNPYPSPLSADLFMDGNPGVLGVPGAGTTMYFWTHNTLFNGSNYVFSDYAAYNRTGSVGTAVAGPNNATPSGIISSGQGFMIRAVTSGNVAFRNSMRVSGPNAQFFRLTADAQKSRLWLDFGNTNGENFKQVLVGYIPNATNGYEDGFDGETIEAGNTIGFYSLADVNAKNLVIQGRAHPFDQNDQVPLGYKTDTAGSYTITLSSFDGVFSDSSVSVYLEDTLLNAYHDLRSGAYTFVTEPGTFNARFILRYVNLLNVNPVQFDNNDVIVFKQHDAIHIETSNINMQSVKVFDIQGRLIIGKDNVNSQSAVLRKVGLANQVLMVQITSVNGITVNKKIIF